MNAVTPIEQSGAVTRYIEPKACIKARRNLKARDVVALDELIRLYRKAGNETPVAITMGQLGKACNMAPMTARRALAALVEKGFIVVVSKGSYEDKRLPSRYRLTMFPCNGTEPTHNYIEDPKAWKRQRGGRKQALPKAEPIIPEFVKIPTKLLIRALEDAEDEAPA
jgi:predicted RNA binding protein YcfA (HicA-like mRNA interferase family)